jgi:hypothetical protein
MTTMCAYDWTKGKTSQIAYIGTDFHIHEIYRAVGQKQPSFADLTKWTGAPAVSTSTAMSGFEWVAGKSKHVVYTDDVGHIHELSCATNWTHADLFDGAHIADSAHAAKAVVGRSISGFDWAAEGTKQIVYHGDNGSNESIQELSMYPAQFPMATPTCRN